MRQENQKTQYFTPNSFPPKIRPEIGKVIRDFLLPFSGEEIGDKTIPFFREEIGEEIGPLIGDKIPP
ncbi:MAG: hypothetical protein ABIL04_05720 [candidate division WOR-3 bacterium]